jgi:transposase-like protein
MNSNIIALEIKSQILEELELRRYSVAEISKIYNVSRSTIYHLQKAQLQKDCSKSANSSNFVELSVSDHDCPVSPRPTMSQKSRLEKAHLVFKDFSIDIEGNINSTCLFEAIKILEISSC